MKLVTRAEWGARAFTCSEALPSISALVVHYSAAGSDEQASHANCAARVRGIQNYHMNTRGWCDVAYNFLFCKHGYVYEGRGWNRKSGATGDANAFSIACCFLGDDTAGSDDVTYAGREALAAWIRQARSRFGDDRVKGHRDYMTTTCPGNELYAWVLRQGWNDYVIVRVRFELWARRKVEGKWKPYLVAKSLAVPESEAPARSTKFTTRVLPQIAALALKNKRPNIRRVRV